MNAKVKFLENKPLCDWWLSVVKDPRFALVTMAASATMFEARCEREQVVGANLMVSTLETIADKGADAISDIPNPGIIYDPNTHQIVLNSRPQVGLDSGMKPPVTATASPIAQPAILPKRKK